MREGGGKKEIDNGEANGEDHFVQRNRLQLQQK
jgi:hypothetical protein